MGSDTMEGPKERGKKGEKNFMMKAAHTQTLQYPHKMMSTVPGHMSLQISFSTDMPGRGELASNEQLREPKTRLGPGGLAYSFCQGCAGGGAPMHRLAASIDVTIGHHLGKNSELGSFI